jgi:tetratricopeptide (TPR) repeat protein
MNLRRIVPAATLAAGIALTATAQTPPAGDDKSKAAVPSASTTPATGTSTPPTAPTNPDLEKAAEAIRKNETVDKVLEHLKNACSKDVNLPPPKVILATIYMQIAQQNNNTQAAQAARTFLEQAAVEDSGHADPFLLSGTWAASEGRLTDAMLCFETALAKSGSARWLTDQRKRFVKTAREGLAQVYGNRRDFVQAYDQVKALLAEDPKNAKVRLQLAQLEFILNQADQSMASLKQAYEDDKSVDPPELMMARFWDSKGEKKPGEEGKAEEFFKKALETYAKDVKTSREYGRWLLNNSRLPDADGMLAKAAGIDAADKETKALMGLSNRYKKNFVEAEKYFDDLNRIDRNNPFYAWNLALSQAESTDKTKREQAVTLAQLTQQSQPRSPEGYSVLAWCLYKADRLDEAEKAIGVATQASQGNLPPDTIYYLARILDKKDKGKDARDILQKALDSKSPFVYRAEAEAFQKELIAKHGPVTKPEEKKPEEKKP